MKEVIQHKDNVDLIKLDGREIYLVGTAHVSLASAELAEEVIREVTPDAVAVELCEPRFQSLRDPDRWKNTDLVEVIRQGKAHLLLAQLMLSGFQRRIGDQLGVKPGEEMMRAVSVAEELGVPIVMADREVRITLRRTWAKLRFFSMIKVMATLIGSLFGDEELDAEEIERLKTADVLEETMREFSEKLPEVREALIDERDQYLAARIQASPGERVVAIVGAGHVPGIKKWLGETIDTAPLDELPPPSKTGRALAWLIPIIVVAMIVYGFVHGGAETSWEMFKAWFLINAGFGAAGSALAGAHPLTILAAFLASPFTSLNPTIAGGWVAGLVEASIRKPRVADFESIGDDLVSFKGLWINRVARILMVIVLTNLLGTIGTFVGGSVVATHL